MGKFNLRLVAVAAAIALVSPLASATVLTFDDIGADGFVPSSYGGLDWSASSWFAYAGEPGAVAFDLYYQGALVGSSASLGLSGTSSFLSSGYAGLVDRVTIRSNDHANFVMDDFTFSAPVPEPESVLMMLAGLGLVGAAARRRKNA